MQSYWTMLSVIPNNFKIKSKLLSVNESDSFSNNVRFQTAGQMCGSWGGGGVFLCFSLKI